jgi:DHA3 family macrolide efflux protein-like MFS transporter
MLKALRHPPIARLWVGQALSSIGDEIYRVGLTWLAVGLIGADTGYLSAAQAAALMILSFIGGKWADHWDPLSTMIRTDFIRGLIVLIPVIYSFFASVPLSLLVAVALLLSGLSAFFDPAVQTVLPKFAPDAKILKGATGLMSTTVRMARMVGPAIVGFLAGILPPIHFFTLDALSFMISAGSVLPLQERKADHLPKPPRRHISFSEAIFAGFHSLKKQKGMQFVLLSKALTGGAWNVAYGLGFALLVQELAPGHTQSFGLVMASYGLGNFAGAMLFGNQERPRPALMMFTGYVCLGIGFILVGFSPTIPWVMLSAAITAFSGPMNEVTFSDLIQSRFPLGEMTRIFRLRMATDTAVTLLLMLLAPLLFHLLSVRLVIEICGVSWIAIGAIGLIFFRKPLEKI